jgi:hypothetical protein
LLTGHAEATGFHADVGAYVDVTGSEVKAWATQQVVFIFENSGF